MHSARGLLLVGPGAFGDVFEVFIAKKLPSGRRWQVPRSRCHGLPCRRGGFSGSLHERNIHALPLGQVVRDDRVAGKELVVGPLMMATRAEAAVRSRFFWIVSMKISY